MLNQLDRALLNDSLYLILGATFLTLGIVSGAFALLRGKVNFLLVWLSLFAIGDGLRLWIQSESLLILNGSSPLLENVRSSINYLVPIPAFFYLREGHFISRALTRGTYCLIALLVMMAMASMILGPSALLYDINCTLMGTAVVFFIMGTPSGKSTTVEVKIVRRGLLGYLIVLLVVYVGGLFRYSLRLEPFGFAMLLGCLGYVAATTTLKREEQLAVIERELELARSIQLSLLPMAFPPSSHFHVKARYLPLSSVAGDFYDFLIAEDDRAGLFIADVSGHGIPAALISSMVKLAAASHRELASDPARILSSINGALYGNTQTQLVTAACVYLDASYGILHYAAAGHPPMIHMHGGNTAPVEENGLLLAAFSSPAYSMTTRPLVTGDRILLYTDGVVEARNAQGIEFGQERLQDLLKQTTDLSTSQAADHIISVIQQWSRVQEDDLTVLICDYT